MFRLLGNRGLWFAAALLTLLVVGALILSCAEDKVKLGSGDTGDLPAIIDDDTGGADDDTTPGPDDDSGDDDTSADDDTTPADDDTGNTWQSDPGGPTITDSNWSPDTISLAGSPSSYLGVWLCDAENDLLVDGTWGDLYVFVAGTNQDFLSNNPVNLSQWASLLGDVSDCNNPVKISISVNFAGGAPGDYCADIGVTDGNGNRSELKTNVCITINP